VQVKARTPYIIVKYFRPRLASCNVTANMAPLLSICTREEQHVVIWFLWAKIVPGAEIVENFQHNMETELYHIEVCMNG
jgi:hypothetical protein